MDIKKIDWQGSNSAEEFAQSLRQTGFAVLTNHSIPADLLEKVYYQWEKFFKSENKNAYLIREDHSGYFPFKSENAKGYPAKDLKEFFHVFRSDDLPIFELSGNETMVLKEWMTGIGQGLLGWLQVNLPDDVRSKLSQPLNEMIVGSDRSLLRVLHYPPLTGPMIEPNEVRAAAHEDINLITLLPAATAPGLQVKDSQGRWYEVPCNPGDIIVNAGDMLQLATGGYYKSTTHRVVNPSGLEVLNSRYSMPLFIHPRPDVVLAPGRTAEEYLNERLAEIMGK